MRKIKRQKKPKKLFDQINLGQFEDELYRPRTSARVFLGIIVIALFLIGSVFQKVKVTQLAQDIENFNKQRQRIEEKNVELKSKLLKLADGKRVIKIAEDRLNMIFPETELLPVEEKFNALDFND